MDAADQKIISNIYTKREGYKNTAPWFTLLKRKGLYPLYITMDGEQSVMRAIRQIWPETAIQRCLYHIQREGMRWLRSKPKTQAGRDLRSLLKTLCQINSESQRSAFVQTYSQWLDRYRSFVMSLPKDKVAYKDLNKTMVLLNNALVDMFHFIEDENIHKTTNALEGFYSRLKSDYRAHRGLSESHKISYLRWYCHFNNKIKTNIL